MNTSLPRGEREEPSTARGVAGPGRAGNGEMVSVAGAQASAGGDGGRGKAGEVGQGQKVEGLLNACQG